MTLVASSVGDWCYCSDRRVAVIAPKVAAVFNWLACSFSNADLNAPPACSTADLTWANCAPFCIDFAGSD